MHCYKDRRISHASISNFLAIIYNKLLAENHECKCYRQRILNDQRVSELEDRFQTLEHKIENFEF